MQDNESEQPPKGQEAASGDDVAVNAISPGGGATENGPYTAPASLASEAEIGPKPEGNSSKSEGNGSKPEAKSWGARHPWLSRIAIGLAVVTGLVLGSLVLYRFVNPPITSVMIVEKLRGETLKRSWVPLEKISPHMRLAVIASEDGNFCTHGGVDWAAVRDVLEAAKNLEAVRGASTIPMQVAKNIYLWEFRSYLRKALEVPLAYALVSVWPKRRVLEVYLNVAQFGPGLFGVEAASRRYFRKPASALTQREAVLLATTLPKPKVRNPARPNRTHRAVANAVQKRLPYIAKRADCIVNR
ncbi:MAG: monofunctional biosynthetic peptidoglycan transglycosylase [Pseudomonadota bacterium]